MRLIAVVFICSSMLGFAQQPEVEGTYDLKVSGRFQGMELRQLDSVMYTDYNNHYYINVGEDIRIASILVDGGKLSRKGNSIIVRVNPGVSKVMMRIFVQLSPTERKLAYYNLFDVVELQEPQAYVGEVVGDSVIRRNDLLYRDYLVAKMERFEKRYRLRVVSFEMRYYEDTNLIVLKSNSHKLTPEMRNRIKVLQAGNPLNFYQIKCRMPDGTIRQCADVRIFVDLDPALSVLRRRPEE